MSKKIPQGRLIALRAPTVIDPKADPPARLIMLKWGDNPTARGNVKVGQNSLKSFAANQHRMGFDEVVLDFEHNTVPGHPSNRGEPAAIAARTAPKIIENEGLIFDTLNWTEIGKKSREHYHDLSPAVQLDDHDEVIFCHSGALSRNGAVYDLHAFSAGIDLTKLSMNFFEQQVVRKDSVDLDLLRALLKLSADANAEDINKALAALQAMPATETLTVLAGEGKDGAAALKEVRALTMRMENSERLLILNDCIRAGKVVPKEWLPNEKGEGGLPIDQLRTLCATLPEIVPLDQRTPEKIAEFSALKAVNPVRKQLQQQLGISDEAMQKYGT